MFFSFFKLLQCHHACSVHFFFLSICRFKFNSFQAHSHCSTLCSQSGNLEFKQFPLQLFYFIFYLIFFFAIFLLTLQTNEQTNKRTATNTIHMIKTDFCFQAVSVLFTFVTYSLTCDQRSFRRRYLFR